MEAIIVAIITGTMSLVGVVFSNLTNHRKIEMTLDKQQAITETKIEALTREVREHNNFARRMPVVEEQIKSLSEKINDIERRFQNG